MNKRRSAPSLLYLHQTPSMNNLSSSQTILSAFGVSDPVARSRLFYLFNFLCQDLNDLVVVDVIQWFAANGTFEEKLKRLCERVSSAAWGLAGVELVSFLVFKPRFQFF